MKKFLVPMALFFALGGFSQEQLPEAVSRAFHAQFPKNEILSWRDNDDYDFKGDQDFDMYYGDFDYDGYVNTVNAEGRFYDPFGGEYSVPEDYEVKMVSEPVYYQITFLAGNVEMQSIFKPDGTFVIAKGQIRALPKKVVSAVLGEFKGKTLKVRPEIEKMVMPNNRVPVYRLMVEIKHGKNHLLKVDGNGKILSNVEK